MGGPAADGGAADVKDVADSKSSGRAPAVSSGQTWRQKVMFSTSLISPMACGAVLFFGKDVYILEMGADVRLMGAFGTVLAIWGPCCNPVVGYCMERDLLVRCFPWAAWGRRAPWFLTHSCVMAVATAAIYVPPALDPYVLCFWYLGWGMLLCWVLAVLFTCFEAGRAELYPTKEERSEVEATVKIASGAGSALGALPQLIIAAGATLQARALASAFFLVIALVSLFSIPIFRLARQAYDPTHVGSCSREFLGLLRVPACRHLMAYRFVEAILNTTVLSGALYYLTLVDGLRGAERSFNIVVLGGIIGITTILALPFWTQFFRVRRPKVNTSVVCGAVTALGALAPLALLLEHAGLPAPWGFFVYCSILQATLTGQTFWRSTALCWVMDEDCQAVAGRRREAIFVGGLALVSAVGAAVAVGLVINGLATAGLHIANCERECAGTAGPGADWCSEDCERRNVQGQPAAVRAYTEALYYALAPVLQLLVALLAYTFPIHGERLEAIYTAQAERFAATSSTVGTTASGGEHLSEASIVAAPVATSPHCGGEGGRFSARSTEEEACRA